MERKGVSRTQGGNHRGRHRKKTPPGLRIKERDGYWHVVGTLRVKGHSVRIRRSTELHATEENWDAANAIRRQKEEEVVNQVVHGVSPSVPLAIAAQRFLERARTRPLGRTDIRIIQEITTRFGAQQLRRIREEEWLAFIDERHSANRAETRERFINTVCAFLNWCRKKPRAWLDEVPLFERDKNARSPRRRTRRRIAELSPELITFMISHASWHLKPQLYVEWSTGWRVSSILQGIRLCDVILAEGREHITTHLTKNGEAVTAALHPSAADAIRDYLEVRGNLDDREGPLFLTNRGKRYSPNSYGAQNKAAFNAMKRRAAQALRQEGKHADADLVGQVTQHWFRHLLATHMLKVADIRTVMEQGGWLDEKSVLGYAHDVPDFRRQKVNELPIVS